MYLIVNEDANEIAILLTRIITNLIKEKPNTVLGLATGSSPIPTYKLLIEDHQINKTDWSKIVTFNLDEYVGISPDNKNSYHYFMNEELFKDINIKKENIHIPNGLGDLIKNVNQYEELIKKYGPINLQILGLGNNGHIGFNEPGANINSITRIVELSDETKNANKRFFNDNEKNVPQQAITMGIATILKADAIVLIATGKNKAQAVKALVQGKISDKWPCSYLQKHSNVLVLVDQEAAMLLDQAKIEENNQHA